MMPIRLQPANLSHPRLIFRRNRNQAGGTMTRSTWAVIRHRDRLHIVPVGDSGNHALDGDCLCQATELHGGRTLHHHSFDGRETLDMALDVLDGRKKDAGSA
jgi:hypothetical protein